MDDPIHAVLTSFLEGIENHARADALEGHSNIGSIFDTTPTLQTIDTQKIQELLTAIHQATVTKETTRRIVNAILVAAKIAADELIK
jgi:hypothetical protein